MSTPIPIHTIILFPKIQADTATAFYLLRAFGNNAFPGIKQAKIEFWTTMPNSKTAAEYEKDGVLLIDIGNGRFDHHATIQSNIDKQETASILVAKFLNIYDSPLIKKLLIWSKRDDIEGKGTISEDPIDRAFGLSAIVMNANRQYPHNPEKTLSLITSIIQLHVQEQVRKLVTLPQLWETLKDEGKASSFKIKTERREFKGAVIQTDDVALAGYLRAAKYIDIVIQRRSTGHTNIITKQERKLHLNFIIKELRLQEALTKGISIDGTQNLSEAGKLDAIPEWFYDVMANTIQNGGVSPGATPPTKLPLSTIVETIKKKIF